MKIHILSLLASATLLAMSATSTWAATKAPAYACETDKECEGKFPGTACIEVDSYGEITKKCTPNTKSRPACRGAQPGLCPSFQSEGIGHLNVHCIFVPADVDEGVTDTTGSEPTENKRLLMPVAVNQSEESEEAGSGDAEVTVPKASTTPARTPEASYAKVTIGKKPVTDYFKCVDVSDCANQAYDPSTCQPLACGSPTSLTQCNNHGTCTYKSIQKMSARSCMCYAGFGGDKCQQEISNECDVDCGLGGDCVDGECKCKKGFDGKAYKGKQGKPNQRCTKCTNDQACQNGNSCDVETGTCVCDNGFSGPTCGATEDACTKMNCGKGNCRPLKNGTAVCYCDRCHMDQCDRCTTKDCSDCDSPASALVLSKAVTVSSILVAWIVGIQG